MHVCKCVCVCLCVRSSTLDLFLTPQSTSPLHEILLSQLDYRMVKVLQLFKIFYLLVILVILILNTWFFHQYIYYGSTVSHIAPDYPENHVQKDDKINSVVSQPSQPTSEHTTKNSASNRDSRTNMTLNYVYPKPAYQTIERGATLVKSSFRTNSEAVTVTSPQPNVSKPPAVVHKSNNVRSTELEELHVVSIRPPTRKTGYVIGVSFWDQQTFSVGNILSMQCWAGHHDMVVAEPFMIDSKFGAPLTAEAMKHNDTMVRLGRLYDLDHWNEYSKKRGYALMVEWNEFLHQAPRDVVIVEFKPLYHRECLLPSIKQEYSITLTTYGFTIVKDLCLEQHRDLREKLPLDNFATSIFGNYTPSDVTVVFTEWSRRTVFALVDLGRAHCHPSHSTFDVISPSKDVRDDINTYIQRQFGGNNYIAVMVRMEWMVMNIHPQTIGKFVSSCMENTLKQLQLIQNQTLLNSTFIAFDVGRFGSKTCKRLNSDAVLEPVQAFFRTVYGNSSSLQQWESTFETAVNKHPSPGYVGYLQKEIAIRAKCILLIGGGTFQRHALNVYRQFHRGTNDSCYAVADSKCVISSSEGIGLD